MTEMMNLTRLRDMTFDADPSASAQTDMVPVLRWTTDEATGRAVSRWILEEKQGLSRLSLTI